MIKKEKERVRLLHESDYEIEECIDFMEMSVRNLKSDLKYNRLTKSELINTCNFINDKVESFKQIMLKTGYHPKKYKLNKE